MHFAYRFLQTWLCKCRNFLHPLSVLYCQVQWSVINFEGDFVILKLYNLISIFSYIKLPRLISQCQFILAFLNVIPNFTSFLLNLLFIFLKTNLKYLRIFHLHSDFIHLLFLIYAWRNVHILKQLIYIANSLFNNGPN